MEILKKDKELGMLKIFNWSGEDIITIEGNKQKLHINKILLSLFTMNQDWYVWMNGLKCKIKTG